MSQEHFEAEGRRYSAAAEIETRIERILNRESGDQASMRLSERRRAEIVARSRRPIDAHAPIIGLESGSSDTLCYELEGLGVVGTALYVTIMASYNPTSNNIWQIKAAFISNPFAALGLTTIVVIAMYVADQARSLLGFQRRYLSKPDRKQRCLNDFQI